MPQEITVFAERLVCRRWGTKASRARRRRGERGEAPSRASASRRASRATSAAPSRRAFARWSTRPTLLLTSGSRYWRWSETAASKTGRRWKSWSTATSFSIHRTSAASSRMHSSVCVLLVFSSHQGMIIRCFLRILDDWQHHKTSDRQNYEWCEGIFNEDGRPNNKRCFKLLIDYLHGKFLYSIFGLVYSFLCFLEWLHDDLSDTIWIGSLPTPAGLIQHQQITSFSILPSSLCRLLHGEKWPLWQPNRCRLLLSWHEQSAKSDAEAKQWVLGSGKDSWEVNDQALWTSWLGKQCQTLDINFKGIPPTDPLCKQKKDCSKVD